MVQEKGTVSVTSKEIINDDLFIGAENVQISGTVNGNVFVGAGTVTIGGTINGDLFVGGGTVTLTGKIKNNVLIGAGDVTVSKASIGDSLIVGSGNLKVDEATTIKGSLLAGAGMVDNKAKIGRNFFAGAGNVSLNSIVGGEARIGAGEIKIGENTKITKDLYYMLGENGTSDLVLPKGAVVSGVVQKIAPDTKSDGEVEKAKTEFLGASKAFGKGLLVISFLGALLVGMVAIKMSSKCDCVNKVVAEVSNSPLSNLGIGFLVLILTVPLALIVMFTGVGASLSMIVLALFGIGVYMAKLAVSLAFGTYLSNKFNWTKMNAYTNLALGLLILFGFKFIPVIGGLTSFVFTSIGMGAFFRLIRK